MRSGESEAPVDGCPSGFESSCRTAGSSRLLDDAHDLASRTVCGDQGPGNFGELEQGRLVPGATTSSQVPPVGAMTSSAPTLGPGRRGEGVDAPSGASGCGHPQLRLRGTPCRPTPGCQSP